MDLEFAKRTVMLSCKESISTIHVKIIKYDISINDMLDISDILDS